MQKEKNRCPQCGQIIDSRAICLYKGLAIALARVYGWCKEKGVHEFERNQINHLMGQVAYSRFGDWILFGGLVYRPEPHIRGHYGLNMERCDNFFSNKLSIPSKIWKNPKTGELTKVDYKFARDIPALVIFLDEQGNYKPEYASPQQLKL